MFKWVLGLCLSIYAVLILFGGEGYDPSKYARAEPVVAPTPVAEEVEVTRAALTETAPLPETVEADASESTATGSDTGDLIAPIETTALDEKVEALVASAVEETAAETRPTLVLQPATGTVATPAAILPQTETAETPRGPVGEIWTVTGQRVNLRSGASTRNGVVGQTVRGESAEIVEMLDNGWAKVYIIETGIEAYMSAKFLAKDAG